MLGRPEAHFSFAGLKTAVRQQARALSRLEPRDVADLCAGFEAAAAESVADRVRRASELAQASLGGGERHLVLAGGVAANERLRRAIGEVARRTGYRLYAPPAQLCTDNAAMVAWAGAERLRGACGGHDGARRELGDGLDFPARARWPLDPDATPALGAGKQGAKA
jgi:N6-L-threonylcarbamoyladenine synthase